jgi:3-methyladenine DNA glycosylase AlkD
LARRGRNLGIIPAFGTDNLLREKIYVALLAAADPSKAAGMQAYMKSTMPYLGVSAVPLRAACKRVFSVHRIENKETWQTDVLDLWRNASYREERYAAMELAGDKRARSFHTMAIVPMIEEMIVTGAWWDYVDALASHRLGQILEREPKPMKETMLAWSTCDNVWKRRSAIICQLSFREKTDLELLYACIEPSLASKDFWLRKAIGWALRQYAWTNPKEVKRYVKEHEEELSGLSKREALKNIGTSRTR